MNSMKTLTRIAAAAAIASGAAGAATAGDAPGQDWKGYAGVNCLPQSNNDPVRRSAVAQTAFSNTGTSTITVFCPVVRDDPVGGPARVTSTVLMRNRSAISGSCEFSSHDIEGRKVDTKTAVIPPGEVPTSIGPLNTTNWGSYVLQCALPGRHPTTGLQSYIVNYRIDEKSP
jgi:hypothetical protein